MQRIAILICLVLCGCAGSTKTSVSIFLEKDLWVDSVDNPDAKARVEYKIEQCEPWPFATR